ncbi:unnamed protein product [Ranitomeya imitator]|uniref:Uncharacterized protein n=1 Tax=Ranitomeya imitator TaxID=111125 RepID=A0ABN9M7R9_9NEOB|nr:unnamed protein product [Ranitomeya imitator]
MKRGPRGAADTPEIQEITNLMHPNNLIGSRGGVIILYPSVSVIILYPECQCHYPVPRVSLSCTPSVSVIILYPECLCHYPVPPSVSVIILYPECQCHYPVPRVVSVIILYPECQCHYPVHRVSVSLSCTPSVSVIILYPECQRHYPVPRVLREDAFTSFSSLSSRLRSIWSLESFLSTFISDVCPCAWLLPDPALFLSWSKDKVLMSEGLPSWRSLWSNLCLSVKEL